MKIIDYKLVGNRLRQAREEKDISLEEAGNKVGVNKSTVLRWENGMTEKFKIPTLEILAEFYGVNPSWLMGHDVSKYNKESKIDELGNLVSPIPILGNVKAGYNYLAQENWQGTINFEKSIVGSGENFFALYVKGDSMSPVLIEGDIVLVQKQNDCENNELAIVLINGDEATIKKVKKTDAGIILQPFNSAYEPKLYTYDEIRTIPVEIIGVVKQMKRFF